MDKKECKGIHGTHGDPTEDLAVDSPELCLKLNNLYILFKKAKEVLSEDAYQEVTETVARDMGLRSVIGDIDLQGPRGPMGYVEIESEENLDFNTRIELEGLCADVMNFLSKHKNFVDRVTITPKKITFINTAMKPIEIPPERFEPKKYFHYYHCPFCKEFLHSTDGYQSSGTVNNFCSRCGQKINWNGAVLAPWNMNRI